MAKEILKIIPGVLEGGSFKFEETNKIEVCFNPTDYSVNKSNQFSEEKNRGLGSGLIQFSHGNSGSLTLKLLLDTYAVAGDTKEDVRKKYIEKLEKLIEIDGEIHAPPPCQVIWGSLVYTGVVESIDKEYILFTGDGTPVRARVTLKLKEFVPVEIQVKKYAMSSPDRRKVFTVKEGDSIWMLANKAYGDPGSWRVIAEANKIDDPKELDAGQDIIIPVLVKNRGMVSH
jgi:hypothetical protein